MEYFDQFAFAWDLLVLEDKRWAREGTLLRGLLEQAGTGEGRVLDLGCGTGFHARHLALECSAQVVGADPARQMLESAAKKPGGDLVHWVEAAAEDPPKGPFDLVLLLGNTISLIEDVRTAFEAVASVTVAEGIFAFHLLDYDRLREQGEHVIDRANEQHRVVKTLTPIYDVKGEGARLRLQIYDASGHKLQDGEELLRDHAHRDLIDVADSCGWRLLERRASFEDPLQGGDRIYTLKRLPQIS